MTMSDSTATMFPDSLPPFYLWDNPYEQPSGDTLFVFPNLAADSVAVRPSLLAGHGLAPQHESPVPRTMNAAPAWLFAVIVLLCAATCLFCRSHKIRFGELLKSTVNLRAAERLLRGMQQGRVMPLSSLAPILCFAIATAVWTAAMRDTGFVGWLLLAVALTVGYLLRNILLRLLANIFDRQSTMSLYIGGNYLFHLLLTTAVVPLLFAEVYIHGAQAATLLCMAVLASVVFFMRFIRGVQLFLTKTKSFSFFLFYYLCIVEIAPMLVLLKWFISH